MNILKTCPESNNIKCSDWCRILSYHTFYDQITYDVPGNHGSVG